MKMMKSIILFVLVIISCSNNPDEISTNKNSVHIEQNKKANNNSDAIVFNRKSEPRENAFSLLIPKGWQVDGGIFRVDPLAQGGPSQSIASKLDFTVKNNNEGSVMIRWLPDVLFFDARYSPAGQMGLFPEGSNYQGMTVMNIQSANQFIKRMVFKYAHPNIASFDVIEEKQLKELAQNYNIRVKQMVPYSTMSYDAALLKLTYNENSKNYEEWIFSIVENWGQLGAGMWGNKETFLVRTPKGEMKKWEPIFNVIRSSFKINMQWLMGEIKGQAIRGEIAANTQKEIERIGREITEHRQRTNAEINNDMYLNLTGQEEYVNPYTNEIEVGTNEWKHRWENESGDVIYSDNEEYDPNIDINLNRSDYKRSEIRKRFPQ